MWHTGTGVPVCMSQCFDLKLIKIGGLNSPFFTRLRLNFHSCYSIYNSLFSHSPPAQLSRANWRLVEFCIMSYAICWLESSIMTQSLPGWAGHLDQVILLVLPYIYLVGFI